MQWYVQGLKKKAKNTKRVIKLKEQMSYVSSFTRNQKIESSQKDFEKNLKNKIAELKNVRTLNSVLIKLRKGLPKR